ncbi:MAG TPA: response regulator transcription factor [Bryobacteraceae bacterium]|nr:response regulator transcription factor [Bryobacteraceae bacterium]
MTSAKILVVDDEPQIRRIMRTTLTAEGYSVYDARSGEEALVAVREQRFDLILLDVNMPGIGGLEACRSIRSSSDTAIVMLTVRSAEEDKVAALDAGADDYVTKPFGMPELLARIRAALRRLPVSADSAVIRAGDLEINPSTRTVKVGGREVRLTPKEFDLLQFLATNPNVPIAHVKLLQAVWGPDYGDEVEYLRTFINQVRKKIEKDPAHPRHVITEPWVGYKFQV